MTLLQIAPMPVPPVAPERSAEASLLAIVAVVLLSLVALAAAGFTFLRRIAPPDAATLHARVMARVARDVDCARVDVVTTVGPSASMSPTLTLEGIVPSAAARDRVLRVAQAAAREVRSDVVVIDRLTVEAERAA